jgi:hypothetical protein
MTSLYQKIIETVTANNTSFTGKGLTAPVTIDLYAGQPDAPELFNFFTPALFIEYSIEWEHGNRYAKQGKFLLDVHILVDPVPGTENYSLRQTEGLKKIEFYDLVSRLLDGLNSETTGTMALIGEEPRPTEYFNYHVLHFTGMIHKDDRQTLTKHPTPPKMTIG